MYVKHFLRRQQRHATTFIHRDTCKKKITEGVEMPSKTENVIGLLLLLLQVTTWLQYLDENHHQLVEFP